MNPFLTRFLAALLFCSISTTLSAQGTYTFGASVSFDPDYAEEYVEVTLTVTQAYL